MEQTGLQLARFFIPAAKKGHRINRTALKNTLYVILPIICMAAATIFIVLQNKTIAPVDNYLVSQQLYEQGNAAQIRNSYTSDIVEVYLPWKFYLSQPETKTCVMNFASEHGGAAIRGVLLPQGFCYPLGAVRKYLYVDSFFPLKRFLGFFPAYDFSYLLLLVGIYLGFFYFFHSFLRYRLPHERGENPWAIAALLAALCATSFPVARDLQYDGLSQTLPPLLLSAGLAFESLRTGRASWLLGSVTALFLAGTRSSLQAFGFTLIFWVLIVALWSHEWQKRRAFVWLSIAGLALCVSAGIYYHHHAILIFLDNSSAFVADKQVPLAAQLAKRGLALLFSLAQFFLGPILFSFDTVDFSKVLNPLGGREYFSYDGNSVFMSPAVAAFLLLFFAASTAHEITPKHKAGLKTFGLALLADILIALFPPSYKLFYFRFHQWWMLANVGLLLCWLWPATRQQLARKRAVSIALAPLIVLPIAYLLVTLYKPAVLAMMEGKGTLGFEAGLWAFRLDGWMSRILFLDWVGAVYWLVIAVSAWLATRKLWLNLIAFSTAAGLLLNIYHYNPPQPRAPFYQFVEFLRHHETSAWRGKPGRQMPENVNLLVGKPASQIYESLGVKMGESAP